MLIQTLEYRPWHEKSFGKINLRKGKQQKRPVEILQTMDFL